jgi:hypothetical protein
MPLFRVTAEIRFTIEAESKDKARNEVIRALIVAGVEIEASETNNTIVKVQGSEIVCLTEEPKPNA